MITNLQTQTQIDLDSTETANLLPQSTQQIWVLCATAVFLDGPAIVQMISSKKGVDWDYYVEKQFIMVVSTIYNEV